MTRVAAELRQGQKHFSRVGDERTEALIAQPRRLGRQIARRGTHQVGGLAGCGEPKAEHELRERLRRCGVEHTRQPVQIIRGIDVEGHLRRRELVRGGGRSARVPGEAIGTEARLEGLRGVEQHHVRARAVLAAHETDRGAGFAQHRIALYHGGERRRGQQAEVRRHEHGDTCRALGDGGEP
jgi:hypothetical protein